MLPYRWLQSRSIDKASFPLAAMDPPPQPPSETVGSPQEPTAISPLCVCSNFKMNLPLNGFVVNDADADTTFKSSDNVVFKIHSRHLKTASAVLSPGPVSMDLRDTVPLPETSDVLEILFQFIDPPSEAAGYRQPSVMKMEPNLFFRVAEAAEKYAVFGAMKVCLTWMQYVIVSSALSIAPDDKKSHCRRPSPSNLKPQRKAWLH